MPVKGARHNSGFTLVETMVALTLLCILMVSVYTFFLSGVISWKNNRDKADVQENLRIAVNRLARELRQAKSIHFFDLYSGGRLEFNDPYGKIITYYCATSGDPENARQLIRAVNGTGNNPVARYIKKIMVEPVNCSPDTRLITITLLGEKGKTGEIRISTTVMLRQQGRG